MTRSFKKILGLLLVGLHPVVSICSAVLLALVITSTGCDSSGPVDRKAKSTSSTDERIVRVTDRKGVTLNVEVAPKEPKLSDLVDLTITITYPTSMRIEPPVFGQSVGDFAVRDYSERTNSSPNTSKSEQGTAPKSSSDTTQVIRYKLEPMFSGKHLIRSIPIVLIEKSDDGEEVREILQSEPIEVVVVSEFGEVSSDLSQVDPMIDPVAPKQSSLWLGLVTLAVVLTAVAVVLAAIRKRKSLPVVVPRLSPEDAAKIALLQLVAEELPSKGLVKEFYLRLTGIVRIFIEGKTGLRAPEQTTEEFLRDMRACKHFDGPQANRLQEFLTAADLVKYAGQTPDESSIRESLHRAEEFISMRFSSEANEGPNSQMGNGSTSKPGDTLGKKPGERQHG
ncbi:hypothetical protein SH449x_000450 [Pirellulaceae bacterium SH449]